MDKKLYIISVLVLMLIGGLVYVALHRPSPVEKRDSAYVYTSAGFSIEMEYPIIPGESSGIRVANETLKQKVLKEAEEFKTDSESKISEADYTESIQNGGAGYYVGFYSIQEKNERYVSLTYSIESYSIGAAHPFHYLESYIFDYQADKFIEVSDMFKSDSDYLDKLSQLSREDLMMLLEEEIDGERIFYSTQEQIIEGTEPKAENFENVYPTKDGLAIFFEEYKVASYAAGPQFVEIPYEKLRHIIEPSGVLGMYIKK